MYPYNGCVRAYDFYDNRLSTTNLLDTIKHFVDMVECGKASQVQSFANFVETYSLLESIRSLVKQL